MEIDLPEATSNASTAGEPDISPRTVPNVILPLIQRGNSITGGEEIGIVLAMTVMRGTTGTPGTGGDAADPDLPDPAAEAIDAATPGRTID